MHLVHKNSTFRLFPTSCFVKLFLLKTLHNKGLLKELHKLFGYISLCHWEMCCLAIAFISEICWGLSTWWDLENVNLYTVEAGCFPIVPFAIRPPTTTYHKNIWHAYFPGLDVEKWYHMMALQLWLGCLMKRSQVMTSVPCERAFLKAGQILYEQRCKLK